MKRRFPPRSGEWIDRDRPVAFRFEGQPFQGYAGDTISSALFANDVRMVGRSFKYHRPRGSYSMANLDANAMFTDGCRTNIHGDVVALEPDLDLRAVNTAGGLARDRLRIVEKFSRFMPVGFYYKAFHRPRWLFPFHENQIRKMAGLGPVYSSNPPTSSPKDYAWCDVLVVGGGPSGMSAALAAAESGAKVMLVEENARLGGSLAWQRGGADDARNRREELKAAIGAETGIEVRCGTVAGGVFADHWIALFDEFRMTKLRARSVVFATGAYEQPAVFGNNDLPGVLLGSAAQRLMHLYAVKPCDAAVVFAANTQGYATALQMKAEGIEIKAVIDPRPDGGASSTEKDVEEADIPVKRGHVIYEATHVPDKSAVTGAVVCALDREQQPDLSKKQWIAADGLIVSVGWMPNAGLPYQAGARFTYVDRVEQLVPKIVPDGIYVAGKVNGVFALTDRLTDGRRAGLSAARHLGLDGEPIPHAPAHQWPAPSHPYPIFSHEGKKNFVDFDEDLHLADFVNAHQEGYDSVELIKRYATVGMGVSQGKLANMNTVRILARLNGKSINETGTTTSRPYYQPVSLGHLAGRRFHPIRHTPMHDWHVANNAFMVHAGAWYRPEYYRRGAASREDSILAEATHVRRNLGLIDLSTLGKMFICGPDAMEFLQRLYTGRFAKLAVGKHRYAVALDESGVVIEDGVVARLAEDVYYVTATSSGVAGFYREMQRWAMTWGMNVTLMNATGQYAAMNIAGPHSRKALSGITDVDLSPEAFPYLGAREGKVANVKAIVLRVGFVGELGYEVHVPSSVGMHVWQALLDEGKRYGIQSFGVEAQRLLRLEKGHLIVSHDTDALTYPDEADLAWAIGRNKDFFIGQRSVEVYRQRPLTRKLVGVRWPQDYGGPLPEECHLMIDARNNRIVGRVTSIAPRSTLGYPLGMAFVHPDWSEPDSEVEIRVTRGAISRATVVKLPHYDPENARQND